MMSASIGRYTLTGTNDGRIAVDFVENGVRCRMLLSDLEGFLNARVMEWHEDRARIAELFTLFHDDPTGFLDHPEAKPLLDALDDPELIPGEHYEGKELSRWHLRQLVTAYNRVHGTEIQPGSIAI